MHSVSVAVFADGRSSSGPSHERAVRMVAIFLVSVADALTDVFGGRWCIRYWFAFMRMDALRLVLRMNVLCVWPQNTLYY